jgi:GntR family transcriptional repressor for pyruvate dehydrogenase complex
MMSNSERLYQLVVEDIERRILDGQLQLGDKLPSERELAEKFNVSRTAVREAVRALGEKGLVQSYAGRGTFVTNGASRAMRDSIGLLARIRHESAGQVVEDNGIESVVELREALEPQVAAYAARRATCEDVLVMQQAIDEMDEAIQMRRLDHYARADVKFHMALAQSTHNRLFPALMESLVHLLQEQMTLCIYVPGAVELAQDEHKRILQAVKQGDDSAAKQAMRRHLLHIRNVAQAPAGVLR